MNNRRLLCWAIAIPLVLWSVFLPMALTMTPVFLAPAVIFTIVGLFVGGFAIADGRKDGWLAKA